MILRSTTVSGHKVIRLVVSDLQHRKISPYLIVMLRSELSPVCICLASLPVLSPISTALDRPKRLPFIDPIFEDPKDRHPSSSAKVNFSHEICNPEVLPLLPFD